MLLEGERTLPGTPEKVWEMLLDPDVLVAAIPGCEKLDRVGEDQYEGRIAAKIGAIQSTFDTTFKIRDKHPPERYKIDVEGQGAAGFVNGVADMSMTAAGADETRLSYTIDANVGGRLAQVGQRMVRATATTMIDRGFNDLRDRFERELHRPAAPSGQAAATAPTPPRQPSSGGMVKRVRNFFSTLSTFLKAFFSSPPEARSSSGSHSSEPPASGPSASASSSSTRPSSRHSPLPGAHPSPSAKAPSAKRSGSGRSAPAGRPSSGTSSPEQASSKSEKPKAASAGTTAPAGLPSSRGTPSPSSKPDAEPASMEKSMEEAGEAPPAKEPPAKEEKEENDHERSASWGQAPPGLPSSGRPPSGGGSRSSGENAE